MEVAGLVVGVAGLAGLYSACLDAVERVKSYRSFGADSSAIDVQLTAVKVRLENWGKAVGFVDGNLNPDHHAALDDENTCQSTKEVFQLIQSTCGAEKNPEPASFRAWQRPATQAVSRGEKFAWALGGRLKRKEKLALLTELVQRLHDLVPPGQKVQNISAKASCKYLSGL